jgi:outer membrane lipoprotein SlyB
MKRIFAAAILTSAALGAAAAPYAPQEFDFSGLDVSDGSYGVVETVNPAPRTAPIHTDVFEHSVEPDAPADLLIRLDSGTGVTLVQYGPERFRPGQRVQLVRDAGGLRAEPAGLQP